MNQQTITVVPDELPPRDAHRIMLSVVVPRPIAWVSTVSADGMPNLAPYSFFNGVSGNPPIVMFSISARSPRFGGGVKDTLRNIRETGEFVVNLVDEALAEAMNQTAGQYAYGVSEFEVAGLESAPSTDVQPPRVAAAPVAMEARVTQIIPVEGSQSTMVLGCIVRYHLREGLLRPEGYVDASRMRPIGRLGGTEYVAFGEVFTLIRPIVERA